MEDISNIIEDQRGLFTNMKRTAERFDSKPRELKTRGYAQSILWTIDNISQQFTDTHYQLINIIREKSIASDTVPYLSEEIFDEFQDYFQTFKGKLLDIIGEAHQPHSPIFHSSTFQASSNRQNTTISAEPRLPKIDIPTFSGDYLSWISYRDMFISLVHNNVSLSKIQKYYFLKSSCSGIPRDIINEYPASEENYELAWDALNSRYHNKRKIVSTLLTKMFSIPNSNGTAESIQTILDTTRNCLALLSTLGVTRETYDAIIIHATVNRLDTQTRKEWEQSLKTNIELPKLSELFSFLETTFRTLESISEPIHTTPQVKAHPTTRSSLRRNIHITTSNNDSNCPCCNKRHFLYKCFKFAAMPSAAKRELFKTKGICHNCLNVGHFSRDCRSAARCHTCKQKHHTTIHNEFSSQATTALNTHQPVSNTSKASNSTATAQSAESSDQIVCNCSTLAKPQVLLATIRVNVKTYYGTFSLTALLDHCAQATLITENAAQTLKLQTFKTYAEISGVGENKAFVTRKYTEIFLQSRTENNFKLNCKAFVVPSITRYQPLPANADALPNIENFDLADPQFLNPGEIDLLLGGDIYGEIILPEQKKFKNSIFLQLTHFGWIVSGPTSKLSYGGKISVNICSLDEQLKAFWIQEELLEKRVWTKEEELCEEYFKATTTRNADGRYTVALPFKNIIKGEAIPTFCLTDYSALSRLKHIEYKCKQTPKFGEAYYKFMTEYESLGHMERDGVYPNDLKGNCYFLPHHGVWRESSSTTKLRVVFDGSSKRAQNSSLNDELAAGPAYQNDLPTVINRWRRFKVGFSSDLEKMFRQINVIRDHQKYQQILWRNSTDDDINIYKLSTVTYGTTCAPFLSMRVLHQLAEDEREKYPTASKVLVTDTYVDDVISGADNDEEAINLQKQLCSMLNEGGFKLRKWTSNSKELMSAIPNDYRGVANVFEIDKTDTVKALGLEWCTNTDSFSFKINFERSNEVTKRSILSDAAKLYDPLGWLSPSTIKAKIMFQKLWLLGVDWNDPLPQPLVSEWLLYMENLQTLEMIHIPRWIGVSKTTKLELHGFSDASTAAFAAVVYAKVTDENGCCFINLLQAKTKVSPLKRLSIPRLELCGATLLVKLLNRVQTTIDREIENITYWTDNTTVLCWIRGQSSKWTVYVGNRVAEIQRFSNAKQWKYISSNENPADCASRGISSNELFKHDLWWTGPNWLKQNPENWPKQPSLNYDTKEEMSKSYVTINVATTGITNITTTTVNETAANSERIPANYHNNNDYTNDNSDVAKYSYILELYSSLSKLVRITALIFRYKTNVYIHKQHKQNQAMDKCKMTGFLTSIELRIALQKLIILSQSVDFADELDELKKHEKLSTNNHLARLCPFIDSDNILRVGGRLQNSSLTYSSKHPILLKKKNPLSLLIFTDAHIKTLHGSLQQMQSYVARKYWILYGRNIAKMVVRCCIQCFKYNAKASQQMMGNLPSVRLTPTRPFKHSGVDYAGPITLKQSTARNSVTTKGYICLFICMVTKALHLEAVTSLSTESFMAAFRRFVSRRGNCTDLYSDCGTNFIGASKELQILYNRNRSSLPNELLEILANDGTQWHFIPPATPNFGGLWEAGVKSTKYHLKRLLSNRIVTYEELSTFLAQIESCLNSRPLCPLNNDPTDANALTPSHFLIGEASNCIPEQDLIDVKIENLTRWKVIEKLKQHFWLRWRNEFVCRLQARPKWLKQTNNIQVGDLVLIIDERCPPGQWPMARVKEVHPGKDGFVRVVTLQSRDKTIKRPVSKIALLPSDKDVEMIRGKDDTLKQLE